MDTIIATPMSCLPRTWWLRRLVLACAFLPVWGASCWASTITLQWDPVTAPDLAGYRVYYSLTPNPPFTGTGATQGASPVTVSTQTIATTTGLDPGIPYYFAVTAYNSAGIETPYSKIVMVPELVPPTVAITSPVATAAVSGIVPVSTSASDNVGVSSVEFWVNDVLQTTERVAPYLFSWNTTGLASGAYTLMAKAYDAAGNLGTSEAIPVTVVNDTTPPTVSLTSPVNNKTVSETLAITASATDNVGVTKVEFYLDGTLLFAGNTAPFSYRWDTSAIVCGGHTLSAKAYDAAGNVGESASIAVTVFNDTVAPVVSMESPLEGDKVGPTVPVTASATDNVAVTRMELYVDDQLVLTSNSASLTWNWTTRKIIKGAHTVKVIAYDAADNAGSQTITAYK